MSGLDPSGQAEMNGGFGGAMKLPFACSRVRLESVLMSDIVEYVHSEAGQITPLVFEICGIPRRGLGPHHQPTMTGKESRRRNALTNRAIILSFTWKKWMAVGRWAALLVIGWPGRDACAASPEKSVVQISTFSQQP